MSVFTAFLFKYYLCTLILLLTDPEYMKNIIVTGGAGFIGSNITNALLAKGFHVTVVDNLDPFYDPAIKLNNISRHVANPDFRFCQVDITEPGALEEALEGEFDAVLHLAAKVGVRESVINPAIYNKVNTEGTLNLLNFARKKNIRQFVLASSSSVYGVNPAIPWSEDTEIDAIISPYAVSKRAAELYGMTFSRLYQMRVLVLRLFTVYGPRQRPDLAVNKFVNSVLQGNPVKVFGKGDSRRDYTYVSDVAAAFLNALHYDRSNFEIFNIGHSAPVSLIGLIQKIEQVFGVKAKMEYTGTQTGDVPVTFASISKAMKFLDYHPDIDIDCGLTLYKEWLEEKDPCILPATGRV